MLSKSDMSLRAIFCLLLVFSFFACTAKKSGLTVDISKGATFHLSSPKSFGKSITLLQRVESTYQGKKSTFIANIEINTQEVIIVGFNQMGIKIFELEWKGKEMNFSTIVKNSAFNPEYILADLQLAYWPLKSQIGTLKVEESDQAGFQRLFKKSGKVIINISADHKTPWKGKTNFQHLEKNYSLKIETLNYEEWHE
jgi:hypothetical protein